MIGRRIAHYQVVEKLGAGGMGEVYRARDTRLDRDVALKFLPPQFAGDAERRERFLREARAASALNHPNICTIYEVGEAEGLHYIAMEAIDGEALNKRIARKRLEPAELLPLAAQIAEALAAAHEKRIVHRDIKSANIMITPQRQAKVLDFGLARMERQAAPGADASTVTASMAGEGRLVGTVAYMSPEQARGEKVDARTDIFSFGVVLYEMASGKLPFQGKSGLDVLHAILHQEPPPLEGQGRLGEILDKALSKDVEERYQTSRDLAVDLRRLRREGERPRAPEPPPAAPERNWKRLAQIAAGAAIFFALLPFAWRFRTTVQPGAAPLRKFPITIESASWGSAYLDFWGPVISPDAKSIVYTLGSGAQRRLWVWDLNQEAAREIPGTEAAQSPFWSLDNQYIGFGTFPAAHPVLKKVSVRGGAPAVICSLRGQLIGAAWTPDNRIIFAPFWASGGLLEVSADGGEPKAFTNTGGASGDWYHIKPHLLPGGQALLFNSQRIGKELEIVVQSLPTGERRKLTEGRFPIYSPSGHIIYERAGSLMALPFSASSLKATGDAFPIASNASKASVAVDGTLVYQVRSTPSDQLVWVDRSGNVAGRIGQPQDDIRFVSLFSDGRRVVVRGTEGSLEDLWIHDAQGVRKNRITFHPFSQGFPIPSPGGEEVVFSRIPFSELLRRRSDGSGEETLIAKGSRLYASDWSSDGRYLLCGATSAGESYDLHLLDLQGDRKLAPWLQTPAHELSARFSPDGRFVAYISDETGQFEVYVKPFPSGEGKWQISSKGGRQPHWSRTSGELFYFEGEDMMTVEVTTATGFTFGTSERLFTPAGMRTATTLIWPPMFDVASDGRRFVMVQSTGAAANRMVVVQGLFAAR